MQRREILDIVDENDHVIGSMSRSEIHRLSLKHRACHMLLFNSDHQLFVQKRSILKDNDPGLWDSSAAGHVDSGESYRQCGVRELQEELGLTVADQDLELRFKLPPVPATGMEFATVYTLVSDEALILDPMEVADGRWFTVDEIDQWIQREPRDLSTSFRLIWTRLRPDLPD